MFFRPQTHRLFAVRLSLLAALCLLLGLSSTTSAAGTEVRVVSRFSKIDGTSRMQGPDLPVAGFSFEGGTLQWTETYSGTEFRGVTASADMGVGGGSDAAYSLRIEFPTERVVRIQGTVNTSGDEGCGSCVPTVSIYANPLLPPYQATFYVYACAQGLGGCTSSQTFDTTLSLQGVYDLGVIAQGVGDHAHVTFTVDGGPSISVGDATELEGGPGAGNALAFQVSLSAPAAAGGVSVSYGTSDGSAHAGSDYAVTAGVLVFAEGEQAKDVPVSIVGDSASEPAETMTLTLSNPTAGATIADATGTGTILDDDNMTFDWTVPDRFGLDANGNSLIDYFTTAAAVSPPSWRVDFTYSAGGTCNPALSPSLTIDGIPVPAGSPAILASSPALCKISYGFPLEKKYAVKLELRNAGGTLVASLQKDVVVQDFLIVSLGDSVASGEGNPDIPGASPQWENRQCHRSASAGPAQAALAIERADPKTSVTFIHLACSGASVFEGILTRYRGQEPGAWIPPQVDQMDSLVGTREIDAVTVSAGANDVRFSTVVTGCFLQRDCHLLSTRFSMLGFFNGWLPLLPGNYDALALTLRQPRYDVAPARTYITEYFDVLRDDAGAFCDQVILEENRNLPIVGISAAESQWASTDMMVRLNQQVAAGASRNGWRYVGGVYSAFRLHGYCAVDRWIVQLTESLAQQRNPDGTIHPNELGHNFYASRLIPALTADLYVGGDLTKPRLPR